MRIINWSLSEQSQFTDICSHESLGRACAGCEDIIEEFLDVLDHLRATDINNNIYTEEHKTDAEEIAYASGYDEGFDAALDVGWDQGVSDALRAIERIR